MSCKPCKVCDVESGVFSTGGVGLIICGIVTDYCITHCYCCCSRRGRFSLLGVFLTFSLPTSQPHQTPHENVTGSLTLCLYHTVCSPVLFPCCVHPTYSFSSPAVFSSLPRSSSQGIFCHKVVCVDDDAHSSTNQQRHEQSHFFCTPTFLIDKQQRSSPCAMEDNPLNIHGASDLHVHVDGINKSTAALFLMFTTTTQRAKYKLIACRISCLLS